MGLRLEIVTPDKPLLNEEVNGVVLPGVEGELGILPGHIPLMTTLRSGKLVADTQQGRRTFAVHGGFVEVFDNHVIVLTNAGEDASKIDMARAQAALERARDALRNAEERGEGVRDAEAIDLHKAALQRARARIFVAEQSKR